MDASEERRIEAMSEASTGDRSINESKWSYVFDTVNGCGAFGPTFFGEVVVRIKAGNISGVDVKRTFS